MAKAPGLPISEGERDTLVAFDDQRAARLAGISLATLRRWERLEFVKPSVTRKISPRNTVRLYGFADLEALLVVATLRDHGRFTTRLIRRVIQRLAISYRHPLTELRFAISPDRREIYFQHPDGTWEGSSHPGQVILSEVLDLEMIRAQIRSAAFAKRTEGLGTVVRQRKVMGRRAVFAGTRIPVDTVVEYLEDGCDDATIIEAFPRLTAEDIGVARSQLAALS